MSSEQKVQASVATGDDSSNADGKQMDDSSNNK